MSLFEGFFLFFVGLAGGSFGTFIGGSSLLSLPTLILLGLPPHLALGTNRIGVAGLNVAGWLGFHQERLIDYRLGLPMGLVSLVGAAVGVRMVLNLNGETLTLIIAGLNFFCLALLIFHPTTGIEHRQVRPRDLTYCSGLAAGFGIGAYSSIYGAGSGTLYAYLFVLLFGQTFLESAGTRKIPQLMSAVMAAFLFALNGMVEWLAAGILFTGMFMGSYLGVRFITRIGNNWIKKCFMGLALLLTIRLIW